MREIKFRIWSNHCKKYIQDEDMYYISADNGEVCKEYYSCYESSIDHVYESIAEQYTGLNDKNGVEIYEGDIVKQTGGYSKRIFRVEYMVISYNLSLEEHYDDGRSSAMWALQYEVIGNIHENSELLKDTK